MSNSLSYPALASVFAEHGFARRLAASLVADANEAEDLVQQTWLRAIEHGGEAPRQPRAWLARVMRGLVRDRRRAALRRRRHEQAAARVETLPSSTELVANEEQRHRLVLAVAELTEEHRAVLLLRYRVELPPRRIAQQLGVPVETVKTRLRRAKAALRETLDRQAGGDRRTWLAGVMAVAAEGPRPVPGAPPRVSTVVRRATGVAMLASCIAGLVWMSQVRSTPAGELAAPVAAPDAVPIARSRPVIDAQPDGMRAALADRADRDDSVPGLAIVCGRMLRTAAGVATPIASANMMLITLEPPGPFRVVDESRTWSGLGIDRHHARSGPDGAFRFENVAPGAHLVLAWGGATRGARRLAAMASPGEELDLGEIRVASDRPELRGRIVDVGGAPIAGARVCLSPGWSPLAEARVRPGLFAVGGRLMVAADRIDAEVVAGEDWHDLTERVRLDTFGVRPLIRGGALDRAVLDQPAWLRELLTGLAVLAPVTADDDGRFALAHPGNGVALLWAKAPDGRFAANIYRLSDNSRSLGTVEANPDIDLDARVIDHLGTPVVGAEVCVLPTRDVPRQGIWPITAPVRTDRWGRASAKNVPLRYYRTPRAVIAVRPRPDAPWVTLAPELRSEIDELSLPAPGRLQLSWADGRPLTIDDIAVVQGVVLADAFATGVQPAIALRPRSRVTAEGALEIDGLPPGLYTVLPVRRRPDGRVDTAIGDGYRDPIAVRVESGRTVRGTLAVAGARHMHAVRVIDARGRAVGGARVVLVDRRPEASWRRDWLLGAITCTSSMRPLARVRTDSDGRARLGALPAGSFEVFASHAELGRAAIALKLTGDGGESTLRLAAPARLTGQLLDHGEPPADRWELRVAPWRPRRMDGVNGDSSVSTLDLRGIVATADIARDGAFTLPPLSPGVYEVQVRPLRPALGSLFDAVLEDREEHKWQRREVVVLRPGARQQLVLDIDTDRVAQGITRSVAVGSVVVDGEPHAHAEVTFEMNYTAPLRTLQCRTDATGRYRVEGLRHGPWNLRVRLMDRDIRVDRLVVSPGDSAIRRDVELRTGELIVRLQTRDGKPAAGYRVSARARDGGPYSVAASADAEGRARLRLPCGDYSVSTGCIPEWATVARGEPVTLDMTVRYAARATLDIRGDLPRGEAYSFIDLAENYVRATGEDDAALAAAKARGFAPGMVIRRPHDGGGAHQGFAGRYRIEARGYSVTPEVVDLKPGDNGTVAIEFTAVK